jgi:Nucleotide modification associated domain 3
MKALLLRVGIDKGTDGALAPIFSNGTFEYIPLSEKNQNTQETKTFNNTKGVNGVYFSHYLPKKIENRKLHFDPEFETFTYGDQTAKRNYLLKLNKNDLIVFYSGLTPHENQIYEEGLYIIGYFTVENVIDFNTLSGDETIYQSKILKNNAHIKSNSLENLVIIKGQNKSSKLIEKAILISQKKLNKIGRHYHAVSPTMEKLLGITGSIQRSIPPRFVTEHSLNNLKDILDLK